MGDFKKLMKRLYITKRFTFEYSHRLPNHNGACRRGHGHSGKLYVTLRVNYDEDQLKENETYQDQGFLIDFGDLKKLVKETVIDKLDHYDLNKQYPIPSAEIVSSDIFDKLENEIYDTYFGTVSLYKVQLWETEDSYVEWIAEDENIMVKKL